MEAGEHGPARGSDIDLGRAGCNGAPAGRKRGIDRKDRCSAAYDPPDTRHRRPNGHSGCANTGSPPGGKQGTGNHDFGRHARDGPAHRDDSARHSHIGSGSGVQNERAAVELEAVEGRAVESAEGLMAHVTFTPSWLALMTSSSVTPSVLGAAVDVTSVGSTTSLPV